TQQHRERAVGLVGDGEVGPTVAREITRHHRTFESCRDGFRGLKCAVTITQEDLHAGRNGDSEVGPTVSVEVACYHGLWDRSQGRRDMGLKGPIAVAQEDLEAIPVSHGEVGSTVTGEVTGHDGLWDGPYSGGRCGPLRKPPVAVAQEHGHAVAPLVGRRE